MRKSEVALTIVIGDAESHGYIIASGQHQIQAHVNNRIPAIASVISPLKLFCAASLTAGVTDIRLDHFD